ncbi:MAG TPA: PIG-L deacetylase family protein [Acidimicrobiales bacterium]
MLDHSRAQRILVVAAHPDDVDFGAAGSVARWVGEGSEVTYCVVTDGDAGGFDPSVPRAEIAPLRRAEQTAAALEVGVTDLIWLGYPDGRVVVSIELRRDIARAIRQVRPNLVVCQSPQREWSRIVASHPDHLAAGEATICAVYPDSRNPFAFPELAEEGWEAHVVDEVFIMGGPDPDTFVEVTETFDRKVAALRAHRSQTAQHENLEGFLRTWLASNGEQAGLPPGRLAEVFRRVDTSEIRTDAPVAG